MTWKAILVSFHAVIVVVQGALGATESDPASLRSAAEHGSHVRVATVRQLAHMGPQPSSIAGSTVRFSLGWRRVLSAWALVLIVILAGFAAMELVSSLGLAKVSPALHGARIPQGARVPQYDPFDVGPPAFEDAEGAWDTD